MRPSLQNLQNILKHRHIFDQPPNTLYTCGQILSRKDGKLVVCLNPYEYSEDFNDFISAIHYNNFMISFDWPSWQPVAETYCQDPSLLASADLVVLRKLLTTHIRKERFCAGHLAMLIESGHFKYIMNRLENIIEGHSQPY